MFIKSRPEFFRKQRLLSLRFYYETDRNHCEGDDRAILADRDRGACQRQQKSRVDRVPDSRVGTGSDEFVLLADRYLPAPVSSDVPARPNCEGNSCGRRERAQHRDPLPLRKEPAIQDSETRIARIEQDEAAHHIGDVEQAREWRFPLLDSFLITRGPDPVHAKRDPSHLDDLKWCRHFEVSDGETDGRRRSPRSASFARTPQLCRTEDKSVNQPATACL